MLFIVDVTFETEMSQFADVMNSKVSIFQDACHRSPAPRRWIFERALLWFSGQ